MIDVSHDDIETLQKFSVSECRSKFPVAADLNQRIMKSYDAILIPLLKYANRTSYVISPSGIIIYFYTALQPDNHVANTLNALRKWVAEVGGGSGWQNTRPTKVARKIKKPTQCTVGLLCYKVSK